MAAFGGALGGSGGGASNGGQVTDGDTAQQDYDTSLCACLPKQLTRSFDDYEALESGEAREFIPQNCLDAKSKSWCLCRVLRENKIQFSMFIEKGNQDRGFALSAKRVGDDFYISRCVVVKRLSLPRNCTLILYVSFTTIGTRIFQKKARAARCQLVDIVRL